MGDANVLILLVVLAHACGKEQPGNDATDMLDAMVDRALSRGDLAADLDDAVLQKRWFGLFGWPSPKQWPRWVTHTPWGEKYPDYTGIYGPPDPTVPPGQDPFPHGNPRHPQAPIHGQRKAAWLYPITAWAVLGPNGYYVWDFNNREIPFPYEEHIMPAYLCKPGYKYTLLKPPQVGPGEPWGWVNFTQWDKKTLNIQYKIYNLKPGKKYGWAIHADVPLCCRGPNITVGVNYLTKEGKEGIGPIYNPKKRYGNLGGAVADAQGVARGIFNNTLVKIYGFQDVCDRTLALHELQDESKPAEVDANLGRVVTGGLIGLKYRAENLDATMFWWEKLREFWQGAPFYAGTPDSYLR